VWPPRASVIQECQRITQPTRQGPLNPTTHPVYDQVAICLLITIRHVVGRRITVADRQDISSEMFQRISEVPGASTVKEDICALNAFDDRIEAAGTLPIESVGRARGRRQGQRQEYRSADILTDWKTCINCLVAHSSSPLLIGSWVKPNSPRGAPSCNVPGSGWKPKSQITLCNLLMQYAVYRVRSDNQQERKPPNIISSFESLQHLEHSQTAPASNSLPTDPLNVSTLLMPLWVDQVHA
jgi:hypothetical protein